MSGAKGAAGLPSILRSDRLKMKRTWLWALTILGAVGVVGLTWVNYALRYEYIVMPGEDHWRGMVMNIHFLLIFALPVGNTLLATMMVGMEHTANAWKQIFALPVSRTGVYMGKFLWLFGLLLLASLLTSLGTAWLGLRMGFGPEVPWKLVLGEGVLPFLAAMPLLSLQLWLSMTFANQGWSMGIGVVGTIAGMSLYQNPATQWLPWAYPILSSPVGQDGIDPAKWVPIGVGLGILGLLAGMWQFVRRDVR
jgi:lantibiotic transport system permease protein